MEPSFVKITRGVCDLMTYIYEERDDVHDSIPELEIPVWDLVHMWGKHLADIAEEAKEDPQRRLRRQQSEERIYTASEIRVMDEDELRDVIREKGLDVNISKWQGTLREKQNGLMEHLCMQQSGKLPRESVPECCDAIDRVLDRWPDLSDDMRQQLESVQNRLSELMVSDSVEEAAE
jgi:hypothetical protein